VLKVLGIVSILSASLAFGALRRKFSRQRLETLRELCESLFLLEGELELNRSPLQELMRFGASRSAGSVHSFYRCLSLTATKLGEHTLSSLWEEAARYCFPELKEDELSTLLALGNTLGRAELRHQLSSISICRNRLQAALTRAEETYKGEGRLAYGVPAALGAIVSILLL
jgi:stage III sporulation protein AB